MISGEKMIFTQAIFLENRLIADKINVKIMLIFSSEFKK